MSTHKSINEETLNNLLYLSRLSPESTNISILKKQVDDIVGYFEILSKYQPGGLAMKIIANALKKKNTANFVYSSQTWNMKNINFSLQGI